jgi:hypothetical protein
MPEHYPGDRPGHLDIDAVSAFIDRDLTPDDLTTIAGHLRECPPCHREVLEIRTTVALLAGLPQYAPRRSFSLGHEHARTARRRGRSLGGGTWSSSAAPGQPPIAAAAIGDGAGRYAGWLPGLQAAVMVVGALLLLVTTSDLFGIPPQPAEMLSDSSAPVIMTQAPPQSAPVVAPPPPAPTPAPAASEPEAAFGRAQQETAGTTDADSASEEVLMAEQPAAAPTTRDIATSVVAAVTQPTATAAAGLAPEAEPAETAARATDQPAPETSQPSRLRLVQIALAFALAWLVVSIAGLRWVRGAR